MNAGSGSRHCALDDTPAPANHAAAVGRSPVDRRLIACGRRRQLPLATAAERQYRWTDKYEPVGLEAVEFIVDLEKALGLSIPDCDVGSLSTGRELVRYLCRRMPEIDPAFGSASARWTPAEIEQVVEGLLAKATRRADASLDADLRSLFR